jgi:hypothetical protein
MRESTCVGQMLSWKWGDLTLEMALVRVGLGAVALAPKRRFMVDWRLLEDKGRFWLGPGDEGCRRRNAKGNNSGVVE